MTAPHLTLMRHSYLPTGTYGSMLVGNKRIYTCEQHWNNNIPDKSCIPDGFYEVVRHRSPNFGWCFALVGEGIVIPKTEGVRWGILFHAANWPDELEGCIAPGFAFEPVLSPQRKWPHNLGVSSSGRALAYMMSVLPDIWTLDIKPCEAKHVT